MQFQFESEDGFIHVRLTGLVSLEAWERALEEIGKVTKPMPHDRLVINITGLVGWLGVPERTKIGWSAATHLAHMKKVALLVQPQKVSGVTERAAQDAGLALRVLCTREDAVGWLVP